MARREEDGISRRDFLEGVLLAAGGIAVSSFFPMRAAWAHYPPGTTFPPDGDVGLDPRVLRGGNLRDTFTPAHWLRDERLTWSKNTVKVAASNVDPTSGTFQINADNGQYDLIVVGGGISGLATAFFTQQIKPNAKILILENNPRIGGNASRDDASPALPVTASTAAAYFVTPYDDFLFEWYDGIGVEWRNHPLVDPGYAYYFDSSMPATSRSVWNGTAKWAVDVYNDKGIDDIPFTFDIRQQLHNARQDFRGWYVTNGAPTDPPDAADAKYDYLAFKSLRDYLTVQKGFHPAVADFYDQYATDALACLGQYANAHTSISFLGAEYNPEIVFPGGNSYVARRALKKLIPASIAGSDYASVLNNPVNLAELDKTTNQVRYRIGANALRVEQGTTSATVKYYKDGKFWSATCKAVVLAGQMHTAHRLAENMIGADQFAAVRTYRTVPVPIANVAVRNSQFLVNAGPAYDYYWYGSRYWQDAVVSDWATVGGTPAQFDGTRPNVLTFYSGFFKDPATERQSERVALLTTPFGDYEASLRDDMTRIWGPYGFDWTRDVSAVYLYRWGHGMVVPYVGWEFGQPTMSPTGQIMRTDGPRQIGRRQIGRVSFGAQDSEGAPAIEDAIYAGKRTAQEASPFL